MKAIFNPNDTLTNKISLYHLVLFVVALPYQFYCELVLVSFLLHTIISLKKKHVENLFRKEVLLLVSVFLITLVCTLYTPNKKEAFNLLSRQLAIFIFPVLLSLNPVDLKKYTKTILLAFVFSCTIAIAYLYADAIRTIHYLHLPLSTLFSPAFMNHNFSDPIAIHATYLSLYVSLSIAVCICYFLIEHKVLLKFIYVLSACLLGLGLLQLGSRAVCIAMLLFICLVVPFYIKLKRIYIVGVSLFAIAVVSFIATTASLKSRYFTLLEEDLSEKTADYSIADPRMKRWQVAFELVKNSPLIGYGSGNETDLLKEKYFQNKLYNSYLNRLNAHNQYLSFLLMGGVAALTIYLFAIMYGLRFAIQRKNIVFIAFMLLLLSVSVSENFLFRNKGIFFYSFFFSLFIYAEGQKRKIKNKQQQEELTDNNKPRNYISTSNI